MRGSPMPAPGRGPSIGAWRSQSVGGGPPQVIRPPRPPAGVPRLGGRCWCSACSSPGGRSATRGARLHRVQPRSRPGQRAGPVRLERRIGLTGSRRPGPGDDHATLVRIVNAIYMYGRSAGHRVDAWRAVHLRRTTSACCATPCSVVGGDRVVIFALIPVAPPGSGCWISSTPVTRGPAIPDPQPPGLINRYAALPDLTSGEPAGRHRRAGRRRASPSSRWRPSSCPW